MNKILVTGGSGMVGTALKNILPEADFPDRDELNLLDERQVFDYIRNGKYSSVIHLAAKVGGIKANTDYVGDFYTENSKMNINVLHSSMLCDVKKVVSLLSTCVYPDNVKYPITENQLHLGPPHSSNFGYAHAKRMLEVQSRAYRKQYGCDFVCAIPNNLYGENDNYHLENSHVIPALTRKIYEAKLHNKNKVEVWGNGSPLREFTYSGDIANILVHILNNNTPELLNIGTIKEVSIQQLVNLLCEILEYDGEIFWNTEMPNGQHRKPSSNSLLIESGWDSKHYTQLKDGLKKTCDWFVNRYPIIRGIEN